MGEDLVAILELDPEVSGGEHLDDAPLELYVLFSTHRRREPYALWLGRSMTTTPPNPAGSAEITDEFSGTDALALPAPSTPARYVEDRRELLPGHAVKLLRNGVETFPAWLDAIEAARSRISLEMYIFSDDAIGRKFADALSRAARRGVEVRLIYDFVGCRDTPAEFFDRMRGHGVHVIAYHRYRFWRPRFWALLRRNHRKTLVCDGRIAFAGGLNIANDWVCLADGGGDWHDAVIQVEGPGVVAIEAIFLRTWNRRAKKWARLDPARLAHPPAAGATPLVVISNSEMRERFAIRRAALHAMRESTRRIYLANPYFVPDRGVLRALQRAAARGVDVRLLLPKESDSTVLDLAARAVFGPLLAAGVRIWQSHAVVHTKVLSVDDVFVSIGSYNFDHRSLAYNLEMVVNVVDTRTSAAAVAMLESDIATSEELTREGFGSRPLVVRLLERIAYAFRKWL
jgi:cardiolipin synthase A/B